MTTQTYSSATTLQEELETLCGKRLQIRLNQNRSTMLSVREERSLVRVSLHSMFLEAPSHVRQALARFIQGRRREANPTIQAYVEANHEKMDHSQRLDRSKLQQEGRVYDLQQLYDEINAVYFNGSLPLAITWYGEPKKKRRSNITLGLFHDSLKLVKIHRLLDNPFVPRYFISYVVYHEMLHHVWPVVMSENGRRVIHGREFRAQEQEFEHAEKAEAWLKRNKEKIFSGRL